MARISKEELAELKYAWAMIRLQCIYHYLMNLLIPTRPLLIDTSK